MTTVHLKQTSGNCGATAAAMACDMTQEGFVDLITADRRFARDGNSSAALYQLLFLSGKMPGLIPIFGVDPFHKDRDLPAATVKIDRGLLSGLRVLAAREGRDHEDLLADIVAEYLRSQGFTDEEMSWAPENGLDGDDATFRNPDGFLVRIPLTTPALVFLNTAEGKPWGHCAYWDGEQLFDPAKDAPTPSLEGYSVRQWVPVIDIGKPGRSTLETFDRLERARQYREIQSETEDVEEVAVELCKIRMLRNCLVGEDGGPVQSRSIGDELIVTRETADDMINGGSRPSCEVLKIGSSREDLQ